MKSLRRITCVVVVVAVVSIVGRPVSAEPISIKFTAEGLGLGTADINGGGGTVDPDVSGLFTSTTTGEGSVLLIQTNGLAGPGTAAEPLLVTVTAQTHLDTVTGLPSPNDYQAGVLYISKEASDLPDGRKEGLGVKAFKVIDATGLRELDAKTALAKIEGSKHVSGGTGPTAYDSSGPNGPPHVDEAVYFDFNALWEVNGHSVEVILSEFDPTDIVDLHIERASGLDIDLSSLATTDTSIFQNLADKLWKLKFAGVAGLTDTDLVTMFSIRANDNDPQHAEDTAEHFFITGLEFDTVPEPGCLVLLATGGLLMLRRRRRA